MQAEFTKSCRKSIRQVLKKGVTYRVTEAPQDLTEFCEIYYDTMQRDAASSFYYFDRAYFDAMLRLLGDRLLYIEARYGGKTIAAVVYFLSDGVMHAHLSGTRSEFLHLSPAYVLRYAAVRWGKEHGYRLVHYGGGSSNAEDNPLYLFKRKFSQKTDFDFYVGRKIWDQAAYDAAVAISGDPDQDYSPQYRTP